MGLLGEVVRVRIGERVEEFTQQGLAKASSASLKKLKGRSHKGKCSEWCRASLCEAS